MAPRLREIRHKPPRSRSNPEARPGLSRRAPFTICMVFFGRKRILPPIRLGTFRGRCMTGVKQFAFTGLLAAALALTSSSPAWSHHSDAMFDHDKEVTVTGTVSQWIFRN